jgi:3-hydroxy acid dehydrogenase / malonic semialdehyde reductase
VTTALVTGGSSGIGRAITERLAADGAEVIAIGRSQDRVAAVDALPGVTGLALDIADHDALAAAVGGRPLDIVVCNAGIVPPLGPVHEVDGRDAARAIAVNLTAHVALVHLVLPNMVARGSGHLFVTGSTAGHAPVAGMAAYGATKAALGSFAQSVRLEVAPLGVRVTELVVGRTETDLYRDALTEEGRAALYDGSFVQPEDVAATVAAVLAAPDHLDIARVDVVPRQSGVTPSALR